MNFNLENIPNRSKKPRKDGLTMVMDKGLSLRGVEDFLSTSLDYIDIVKLGFGTSVLTKNLSEKINLYKEAGLKIYLGGTLFEIFIIRNQYKHFQDILYKYGLDTIEISDGSIHLEHTKKCEYIYELSKKFTVISEVGSKESNKVIPPYKWIEMMQKELDAGSWKVVAEAREGGNVGVFRNSGEVRSDLVDEILTKIPKNKIIWEAPKKNQQVWFIKLLGSDVNLGNIDAHEAIPLECLRLGLRGDTFFDFLPENIKKC